MNCNERTISDPDLLDRWQVLINGYDQKISIRLLGEPYVGHNYKIEQDGVIVGRTIRLVGCSVDYQPGDILVIKESDITSVIGHYTIIGQAKTIKGNFIVLDREIYSGSVRAKIGVFRPGVKHDGITLQCLYSFCKEKWRCLHEDWGDLIWSTFPFRAITREQMIMGGVNGAASSAWSFADENGDDISPRQLIRTGGWQERDKNDNVLRQYAGTLRAMVDI